MAIVAFAFQNCGQFSAENVATNLESMGQGLLPSGFANTGKSVNGAGHSVSVAAIAVDDPNVCGGRSSYCQYWENGDTTTPTKYLCVSATNKQALSPVDEGDVKVSYNWTQAIEIFRASANRADTGLACSSGADILNFHTRVAHQTACNFINGRAVASDRYLNDAGHPPLYAYFTAQDIAGSPNCTNQIPFNADNELTKYRNLGTLGDASQKCNFTQSVQVTGIKVSPSTSSTSNADLLARFKIKNSNFCQVDVYQNGASSGRLIDNGVNTKIRLADCGITASGATYNLMSCTCEVVTEGYSAKGSCLPNPATEIKFSGQIPDLSVCSPGATAQYTCPTIVGGTKKKTCNEDGSGFTSATCAITCDGTHRLNSATGVCDAMPVGGAPPTATPMPAPPFACANLPAPLRHRNPKAVDELSPADCEMNFPDAGKACHFYSEVLGPAIDDEAHRAIYCVEPFWSRKLLNTETSPCPLKTPVNVPTGTIQCVIDGVYDINGACISAGTIILPNANPPRSSVRCIP